jgi:hypothetical protein
MPLYDGKVEVLKVDTETGFSTLGTIDHGDITPLRTVRIGGIIYSIGYDAVRVHELSDLDEVAVLELPQPEISP